MSRAFVDEDNDQPEGLPEIPQSSNPGYITPHGLAALKGELAQLEEVERPPLTERIAEGGANATRAEISLLRIDQRINYLRARIARAIVIDPASSSHEHAHFGSSVLVRNGNGEQMQVRIVGEDETDPDHGMVSWVSPLARALMSRSVGDRVTWHRPIGDLELTILAIEPL